MKRILIIAILAWFAEPTPASACGVKLIIKNPTPRRAARATPVRAKPIPVVTSGPTRQPIAAGPPAERKVVAVKQPDPPKPDVTPPPPKPEPTPTVETPPKPEPTPVKPPTPAPFASQELYFGLNSTAASNKAVVDRVAKQLAKNPGMSIVVEGYADPSGDPTYNMALSQRRAEAVRDQLVAAGVDSSRIDVQAFGDTKLRYGKSDARNRRVMIRNKP